MVIGASLVRRPGQVEHVEVGDHGPDQRAIRRFDDDQRYARQLPVPARSRRASTVLLVVGDIDRPDVLGERPPEVHGLDDRPVDAVDRDDDALLAVRAGR